MTEIGGSQITLMRFDVPVGIADPAQRISAIHEQNQSCAEEKSLPYAQLIARALNLMPRWYIGMVLRHVDFLVSDVPGIPVPVYLGGAKVIRQYAFGPHDRCRSECDATCLRRHLRARHRRHDTGAIPDFAEFCDCPGGRFRRGVGTGSCGQLMGPSSAAGQNEVILFLLRKCKHSKAGGCERARIGRLLGGFSSRRVGKFAMAVRPSCQPPDFGVHATHRRRRFRLPEAGRVPDKLHA